ncbi:MAG: LysR family transcriptional regulator [Pseudomonadota bacterium]
MDITIRQLKVFKAVARQNSFTRAAEELHLSQPAVSMQIKQLEEASGQGLFDHLGKKIFLTQAGDEMLRCAETILRQLEETGQVLDEMKGVNRGRLTVTVASTVNYFATRILAAFHERYPGVQIRLEVTNRETLLHKLVHNETDIALMGQPPEKLDLDARIFMENPLVIIAPPDHALVGEQNIDLKALSNETFLMRESGSGTRIAVERFCTTEGVIFSGGGMQMNSNEAIKQGVQAGLGLGVVSIHTVEAELEGGRLKLIDAEQFPILRHWYVVYRRGKRLSAAARSFRDFVIKESARLKIRVA